MSIHIERIYPITSEVILAKELMRNGQITLNWAKPYIKDSNTIKTLQVTNFNQPPSLALTIIGFVYQMVTGRVRVRSQLCAVSSLCSGVSAGKVGNNTEVTI